MVVPGRTVLEVGLAQCDLCKFYWVEDNDECTLDNHLAVEQEGKEG